jgi:hypothetical protein
MATIANITPAVYNLRIPQRASFCQEFTLPFSAVGKTVEGEVWNDRRSRKLLELTTEWVDREEVIPDTDPVEYKARFRLTADWTLTRLVKASGKWDLLVIDDATGERDYWLEGSAILDVGYTEAES